ncbi:MAG: hypothetical protein MZU97_23055 [Bacillus subtilis]|nr:hypothetical protein [Bacillus subtilis]
MSIDTLLHYRLVAIVIIFIFVLVVFIFVLVVIIFVLVIFVFIFILVFVFVAIIVVIVAVRTVFHEDIGGFAREFVGRDDDFNLAGIRNRIGDGPCPNFDFLLAVFGLEFEDVIGIVRAIFEFDCDFGFVSFGFNFDFCRRNENSVFNDFKGELLFVGFGL